MSAIWDKYNLKSQSRRKIRRIWTNSAAFPRNAVAEGGINYYTKIDDIVKIIELVQNSDAKAKMSKNLH